MHRFCEAADTHNKRANKPTVSGAFFGSSFLLDISSTTEFTSSSAGALLTLLVRNSSITELNSCGEDKLGTEAEAETLNKIIY